MYAGGRLAGPEGFEFVAKGLLSPRSPEATIQLRLYEFAFPNNCSGYRVCLSKQYRLLQTVDHTFSDTLSCVAGHDSQLDDA